MKEKIKEILNRLLGTTFRVSNLLIFVTFIVTAWVTYWIGNENIGMIILSAALFYLLFNKVENLNKRIKILEEK